MHILIEQFARETLIKWLEVVSPASQQNFRRMYAPQASGLTIEEIVTHMPAESLDWAMHQVENTLKAQKSWDKVN